MWRHMQSLDMGKCTKCKSFVISDKTETIKRRFYWHDMTKSITRWCDSCASRKPGPDRGKAPLISHHAYSVSELIFWVHYPRWQCV